MAWQTLDQVPIHSVTNGVHVPTWVAPEMDVLYAKHLGSDWRERCDDQVLWQRIMDVPDAEIWEVRRFLKRKMLIFLRQRVRLGWTDGTIDPTQVLAGGALFEPHPSPLGLPDGSPRINERHCSSPTLTGYGLFC